MEEALQKLTGISKSQLLKRGLEKKILNRAVFAKSTVNLPLDVLNYGLINPEYVGQSIEIISESEEVLALLKPNNIHCHPLRYCESDNILSFLRSTGRSDLLEVNRLQYDRGLLYRLDFATSGLVLYIKNESLLKEIRQNFKTKLKQKTYLAKVQGRVDSELSLKNFIKSSGPKGSLMKQADDGREANIFVKPIKGNNESTLVEVELIEGIKHQIRIQLSLAGHPIVGDPLYGDDENNILHLHCHKYSIDSIGSFQATLPPWYIL